MKKLNKETPLFKYLEIKSYDDGRAIKRMVVSDKSDREIEKIERGLNIQLNHEKYYTFTYESDHEYEKI